MVMSQFGKTGMLYCKVKAGMMEESFRFQVSGFKFQVTGYSFVALGEFFMRKNELLIY